MDKSYWISNYENIKNKYPKINKNEEAEIVIIGGGLTGLTTAYYLSKKEKQVILLEKDEICNHTSGNTTAKITSQHGLFYDYLIQSQGLEKAKQYLYANEEAIKNIKNIIEEENIECDFEKQDAYVFIQDKEEIPKLKKEIEALKKLDYNCELVDKVELEANIIGAIKFKDQAQFNPYLYAHGLAQKIIENKGKIFENTKVIDIKKEEQGYEIITKEGIVKAKKVIIATHYPIINAPGFYFMKMYQETSYLIAIETEKQLFNGMYINSENPTISFRTAKYNDKRIVLIGGMGHKTGKKKDLINSYSKLEDIAKKLYPDCKVLYRWNTEDCISLDKIPYIGEFSNLWPNVYVATGYKKWGMTSSNVAANIIIDEILGKQNKYKEVFKSTRLEPIKNYEELTNMVKEVSYSGLINKLKIIDEHLKDVKNREGKIIEIDGTKVGVYKNENGKICAVKPYCSHLGCELSWNNLDNTWDCPCHGSRFTFDRKVNLRSIN